MQVLASAHAVILASGTLAPIASLEQQLFPYVPAKRVHHFSCGHVVLHIHLLPDADVCLNWTHFDASAHHSPTLAWHMFW